METSSRYSKITPIIGLLVIGLVFASVFFFVKKPAPVKPTLPTLQTQSDIPKQPEGSLVIIGGGLKENNAEILNRIVNLSGGKGASIAVFPTASSAPEATCKKLLLLLTRYGANPFCVPLSPHMKVQNQDYTQVAMDPAIAQAVRQAGGVYFSGGDQSKITQSLFKANGGHTLLLDAVWAVYHHGGVIAGTSAGAAIMSSTMFYKSPKTVLATLKSEMRMGKEISKGLGFIGDDVFIDQHLIVRGRFARMLPAMLKAQYKAGLGIDENTAMIVNPSREVEIIGESGAMLIELKNATTDEKQEDFNIANAYISYLDNGDRYNINTGIITPAADRSNNPLKPEENDPDTPLFFPDILSHGSLSNVMINLVDSDKNEARGLAFSGPGAPDPLLGFEFKFSKTPETKTFVSVNSGDYSIYRLRLDVVPIHMASTLYRYKGEAKEE